MGICPKTSKEYYYISTDYRLAPKDLTKIVMKRGILKVTIYPPGLWE